MCNIPFGRNLIIYIICILFMVGIGTFLSSKIIKNTTLPDFVRVIAVFLTFAIIIGILYLIYQPILDLGRQCYNDIITPANSYTPMPWY